MLDVINSQIKALLCSTKYFTKLTLMFILGLSNVSTLITITNGRQDHCIKAACRPTFLRNIICITAISRFARVIRHQVLFPENLLFSLEMK